MQYRLCYFGKQVWSSFFCCCSLFKHYLTVWANNFPATDVLQNVSYHGPLVDLGEWGAWQVSPCDFCSKQSLTFPSMSKLTGEQWLMNSWYEFLTLLESRNMLMNSGRKPSICKVMTKVVMKYSWLACLCLEAQQFIPVYIQHLWPRSGSPLHVWMMVGAWECYKHHCKTKSSQEGWCSTASWACSVWRLSGSGDV